MAEEPINMVEEAINTQQIVRELTAIAAGMDEPRYPLREDDVHDLSGAVCYMARILAYLVEESAAQKHALLHIEARMPAIEEGLGGVASDVRRLWPLDGGRGDHHAVLETVEGTAPDVLQRDLTEAQALCDRQQEMITALLLENETLRAQLYVQDRTALGEAGSSHEKE